MKKIIQIVGCILVFTILAMFLAFILWAGIEETTQLHEHREFIKEHIGKTIVIQQDTLVILNYQEGGFGTPAGFTLSNGVLVNKQLIEEYYEQIH